MKMPSHLCFLIAVFGLCLVVCVDAECGAISADDCLAKAHTEQLPPTDRLNVYCMAAAALIYKVNVCLKECKFTPSNATQNLISRTNLACSVTRECSNIVGLYSDYANCFNKSGGIQSTIDSIIESFNAREITDNLCRSLASGRNCQKQPSAWKNCSFFADEDKRLYANYPQLASVQHICGSENVPDLRDNSACNTSDAMVAQIERNCHIACSISATPEPVTICAFLQDQANCILRYSNGCTEIERRFLLPRLNTYAIINLLLPCSNPIQIRGITVQPAGLSPNYPQSFRCSFIPQINDCLLLDLSEPIRADTVEKLFNGNFILDQFCQLKSDGKFDRQQLMKACENSYLRCRLPVAEIYDRPSTYDNSYNASLGPFPLDPWGLYTILSSLTCPNPTPPTLCPKVRGTYHPTMGASLKPTPVVTKRTTPLRRPTPAQTTKRY